MSIRDLAAAAKAADEAHEKAEQKRRWALNAARAEETVLLLLGVVGKTRLTNHAEEKPHGDGAVVKLEDDLYVKVTVRNIYSERTYYSPAQVTGQKVYLTLCDEKGLTVTAALDVNITSLADLHDALKAVDAHEVKMVEYRKMAAERAAAQKTA